MKYATFRSDAVCPKCAFPVMQMYRQFFNDEHKIMEDKDIKICKINGEHLHIECCCGNEIIFRPLDWDMKRSKKPTVKKTKKDKKVNKK